MSGDNNVTTLFNRKKVREAANENDPTADRLKKPRAKDPNSVNASLRLLARLLARRASERGAVIFYFGVLIILGYVALQIFMPEIATALAKLWSLIQDSMIERR